MSLPHLLGMKPSGPGDSTRSSEDAKRFRFESQGKVLSLVTSGLRLHNWAFECTLEQISEQRITLCFDKSPNYKASQTLSKECTPY